MGLFTNHLSQEHLELQGGLEHLKILLSRPEPRESADEVHSLVEALRILLEELHHRKEEEILFPALDSLNCPLPGGPHCTLHMGQFLEWDLAGTIEKASATSHAPIASKPFSATLKGILARNHFLGIPVSEHRAGQKALRLIQNALNGEPAPELALLSSLYFQLMSSHIAKEDNCLFHMADELLPAELQEGLLNQAIELERRLGSDRIQEARLRLINRPS